MATGSPKQGDTWVIDGVRTDSAGNPVSLAGVDIISQLRRNGVVVDLDAEVVSAALGTYTLTAASSVTQGVKAGVYKLDVQFTNDGIVSSTETIDITVEPDNSRAPD